MLDIKKVFLYVQLLVTWQHDFKWNRQLFSFIYIDHKHRPRNITLKLHCHEILNNQQLNLSELTNMILPNRQLSQNTITRPDYTSYITVNCTILNTPSATLSSVSTPCSNTLPSSASPVAPSTALRAPSSS